MIIQWIKNIIYWLKIQWLKKSINEGEFESRRTSEEQLKEYCEVNKESKSRTSIDQITWHDLELDQVYHKINRTLTSVGEERLVSWMFHPSDDEISYKSKKEKLDFINNNADILSIKKSLNKIDYLDHFSTNMYKIEEKPQIKLSKVLLWMIPISIIIFILMFLKSGLQISILTGVFILFMIIMHYSYSLKHKHKILSYGYLIKIAISYLEIKSIMSKQYKEDENLDALSTSLLQCKYALLRSEGLDFLADFREIMTLNLIRKTMKVDRIILNHFDLIEPLILRIGEIDLIQSVYSFRKENPSYCEPVFSDKNQVIQSRKIRNILLEDSVVNDIDLSKGMIITGSNMSGKSTLLRAVGINVILAQGLGFVDAQTYVSGFVKLISSISLSDQIQDGKSYFMMEAEAIKRMLEACKETSKCLFLIDEIFKGTNPIERLAASVEVLNALTMSEMVMATTHDVEILPQLIGFEYYYFEHEIINNKLKYNYILKTGVSSHKNAIKLMASIGYPKAIINKIYERMDKIC